MREPLPIVSFAVFKDLLRSTILVSPRSFGGSGRSRVCRLGPADLQDLVALVAQLLQPVDG